MRFYKFCCVQEQAAIRDLMDMPIDNLGVLCGRSTMDQDALVSFVGVSCSKGIGRALASMRKLDRTLVTRVENIDE